MKKRLISMLLIAVFVLTFAACGNKAISAEKAQKIAVEDAGVSMADAEGMHTHVATTEAGPCYNIHFAANGEDYNYLISATGEVLSVSNEAAH